jgi:hypothetical protein
MPYFIYRFKPFGILQKIEEHDAFSKASGRAKALRADPAHEPSDKIKLIFAANELEAVDLLTAEREPLPPGEDD